MRIFFIIIILITSCEGKRHEKDAISIRMDRVVESVRLSELIQIDSIVEIKLNDFFRLGDVKKTFFLNDRILVHSEKPNSISLINSDGELVSQYVPDFEMTEISAVEVYDNIIYILDRSSNEIHFFDDNLSNFKKISIPYYAQSIKVLSDEIMAFYVGNEITINKGKLIIYNYKTQEAIADLITISPNERKYFNFLTSYNFLEINDDAYFWNSAQNQVFKIYPNGSIYPKFNFDYGEKGVPENFYEKATYENPMEFLQDTRSKGYAHRHFKVLANGRYVLTNFDYSSEFAITIFDFQNNVSTSFKNIDDDLLSNKKFEELTLSFFTDLHGSAQFTAFLPFEYFDNQIKINGSEDSDLLIFGRFK